MTDLEIWKASYGEPLTVGMQVTVNQKSKYFEDHQGSVYFVNAIRLKPDGKTLDITTGDTVGGLEYDGWTIHELTPSKTPSLNLNADNMDVQQLLDTALSSYVFGEGMTLVGQDAWPTKPDMKDGVHDFTKVVYLQDDESPNADSQKCSFHVEIDPSTQEILDVYAYLFDGGVEIGFYDELAAQGFEAGKWHVISSYNQSLLDGPFDDEAEAEGAIESNSELAGGVTYQHEPSPAERKIPSKPTMAR